MGCCAVRGGVVYSKKVGSGKKKRIDFDKLAKVEKVTT